MRLITLLLFRLIVAPHHKQSGVGESSVEPKSTRSSSTSAQAPSSTTAVSTGTRPPYLGTFYQLLHSMTSFSDVMKRINVQESALSRTQKLLHRLERMETALHLSGNDVRQPIALDDLIDAMLPLENFVKSFLLLLNAAWVEAWGSSEQIEEILSGLWHTHNQASTGPQPSPVILNPIVLRVGRQNFDSALKEYFDARKEEELQKNTTVKLMVSTVMPDYLLMALRWDANVRLELETILTHFDVWKYRNVKSKHKYVLFALFYQNENDGKFFLYASRKNRWMLFDDEASSFKPITREVAARVERDGEWWRCVMAVYRYSKNVDLKKFDLSEEITKSKKEKKTAKSSSRRTDETPAPRSGSEESQRSSTPPSKKRYRSPSNREASSDIRSKQRSSSPRSFILTPETSKLLRLVFEEEDKHIAETPVSFPRVKSIALFLRDIFRDQAEFTQALRNVLFAKHAEAQGQLVEGAIPPVHFGGRTADELLEAYKRFVLRVLMASHARLQMGNKPLLCAQTLLFVCASVETVYAVDKTFFASAIEALRAADAPGLREVNRELMLRADEKGLISQSVATAIRAGERPEKLLNDVLADPLFRKVKGTVSYVQEMSFEQAFHPDVREVLKGARKNYSPESYSSKK